MDLLVFITKHPMAWWNLPGALVGVTGFFDFYCEKTTTTTSTKFVVVVVVNFWLFFWGQPAVTMQ